MACSSEVCFPLYRCKKRERAIPKRATDILKKLTFCVLCLCWDSVSPRTVNKNNKQRTTDIRLEPCFAKNRAQKLKNWCMSCSCEVCFPLYHCKKTWTDDPTRRPISSKVNLLLIVFMLECCFAKDHEPKQPTTHDWYSTRPLFC